MFKRMYLPGYFTFGLLGAILYSIPMLIFIRSANYVNTWWLFLGNGLFLLALVAYLLTFRKQQGSNRSTQTMIAAGHITTILGIIFTCGIILICLMLFIPQVFSSQSGSVLKNAPSQTGDGKTHGLVFFIFMSGIIGNLAAGSVPSIVIPYTSKRDQTKDNRSEVLNN